MPNSKTFQIKPINELIHKYAYGKIIDPFANSNRFDVIVNGWTVDIISWILSFLK